MPCLTGLLFTREQLLAVVRSVSASYLASRRTQLFGRTCVLIEGSGPGIGLISFSAMLPEVVPGKRKSGATGR